MASMCRVRVGAASGVLVGTGAAMRADSRGARARQYNLRLLGHNVQIRGDKR